VPTVSAVQSADAPRDPDSHPDVAALIPIVRRIVSARVADRTTADDLVQETLVRVLAATARVEPGMLEPYAIVTARNVVTSMWQERDRHRRNQHRVVDLRVPEDPGRDLLAREERTPSRVPSNACPSGNARRCSHMRSPGRTRAL